MPYDSLMRWETEGGATGSTNGEESTERRDEDNVARPEPSSPSQPSGPDQGWIKPRRIA
jgi:hypothetical protein